MPTSTEHKRRQANRVPIMVIEPNPDQWLIIRAALLECFPDVEPRWMNHPAQALSYLQDCSTLANKLPSLILLEPYLPTPAEGLILFDFLKAHSLYQQIPIILLTHGSDPQAINQWYRRGISSYIVKPTSSQQWLTHFCAFRRYWSEVVSLPLHPV